MLLAARGAAASYGGADVVTDIDLEVAPGTCLALLGPNGAGKSTLLRLLAGILPARRGRVELRGRPLSSWRRRALAAEIALVPQQAHFAFPLSVREVVEQGRAPHLGPWRPSGPEDRAAVAAALAATDLERLRDAPVQRLSGGERQRVLLARALATRAAALLLDEPASGLDARHQLTLAANLERLRAAGTAIVLVAHDPNLALRLADRAAVLESGRVVANGPPATVLSPELFRLVFGVEVERLHGEDGRCWLAPARLAS